MKPINFMSSALNFGYSINKYPKTDDDINKL